jgi:hypothetical protein
MEGRSWWFTRSKTEDAEAFAESGDLLGRFFALRQEDHGCSFSTI